MKNLYNKLQTSVKHLEKIELVLNSDKMYLRELKKFNVIIPDLYDYIYSENVFQNQMHLADIIEYIFMGRAYYLAIDNKSFDKLYQILVRACNLFFLQDSLISNNFKYRKKLIDELTKLRNVVITKEERDYILGFNDSLAPQVNKYTKKKEEERADIYKKIDGLMPKILGMPKELVTYVHLIRRNLGYVIPLLLSQRLLKGKTDVDELKKEYKKSFKEILKQPIGKILELTEEYQIDYDTLISLEKKGKNRKTLIYSLERKNIRNNVEWNAPPDFLIVTKNKKVYGIEVGSAKQRQENQFVATTGIPILTIFSDVDCSYRCPKCKKWILFSDFAIKNGMKQKFRDKNLICFSELDTTDKDYSQGVCYVSIPRFHNGNRHYHYKCAKDQIDIDVNKEVFYYFPFVAGLECLEKEENI